MTATPPTRAGAADRIRAGHAARDPHAHLGERLARSFRHDAESEALMALPHTKRDALPPSTRVGLALYAGAREAAAALGIDTSAPAGDPHRR